MFRFIFYFVIIVIIGSYLLPTDIVAKIPYGSDTQRFTKQSVGWAVDTIDDLTGGVITNTMDSVKEGAKDKLKDAVDQQIDEL